MEYPKDNPRKHIDRTKSRSDSGIDPRGDLMVMSAMMKGIPEQRPSSSNSSRRTPIRVTYDADTESMGTLGSSAMRRSPGYNRGSISPGINFEQEFFDTVNVIKSSHDVNLIKKFKSKITGKGTEKLTYEQKNIFLNDLAVHYLNDLQEYELNYDNLTKLQQHRFNLHKLICYRGFMKTLKSVKDPLQNGDLGFKPITPGSSVQFGNGGNRNRNNNSNSSGSNHLAEFHSTNIYSIPGLSKLSRSERQTLSDSLCKVYSDSMKSKSFLRKPWFNTRMRYTRGKFTANTDTSKFMVVNMIFNDNSLKHAKSISDSSPRKLSVSLNGKKYNFTRNYNYLNYSIPEVKRLTNSFGKKKPRKTVKKSAKKKVTVPKSLKTQAKRNGVKLTVKRNGKRIPKSAKVLKTQIANAKKRNAVSKKKSK